MELTPEIVRELLSYDPETGVFLWRLRDRKWFATERAWKTWNSRFANKPAGCLQKRKRDGYQNRVIKLFYQLRYEHHLAWMWMTGNLPPEQVDHRNRNAADNRWENLRSSTCKKNARNKSMKISNKSGVTGVHWCNRSRRWVARVYINKTPIYVGSFNELDEAAMAVMELRIEHGFDPMHGMETAFYRRESI